MDIGRYLRISRAGAPKAGLDLSSQPVWVRIAGTLLVFVALVFTGIGILTNQNQLNTHAEALRELSAVEAFRLAYQISGEVASLEDFSRMTSIQESFLRHQGEAAPGPDEIIVQTDPVAVEILEKLREEREHIKSAALVNKNGIVLAISPSPEKLSETRREEWNWLDQPMSTGTAFVVESIVADELTNTSGIHISVPVKQVEGSEELLGVLYIVIDPVNFAFIAPEDSSLHVVTYGQSGTSLIPSIDPVDNAVYDDSIIGVTLDQILEKPSGIAHYWATGAYQRNRLYGYTNIADLAISNSMLDQLGWIVVAQQVGDSATGGTASLLLIIGIGVGIIGIGILLVTFIFSRPIVDLAYIADEIVEHDNSDLPIPVHSNSEIGVLANALRRLADRLSSQNNQLKSAVEVTQESLLPELDELLNRIVQTMGERSGYRGVGIYVVEPNTQRARLAAIWGALGEGLTKTGDILIIGKSTVVGRALMHTEIQRDPGFEAPEFAGAKTTRPDELAVPFFGKVPGALQVIGSKPDLFLEGDIDIMRLIASQIGFILDNRQMLAETQAAREEAEKASRVKSQFLANMSHELRTPLNAVLNFTGFVMDGDTGPVTEEQVSLLSKVYQSGEHLLNLINDILDLSKIEADMMQFLVEEVDLNQMLVSTASVAKGLIKDKNIEFAVQIEDRLPIIQGDKRRLRQVLLNLISNAVKFTRQGSVSLDAFRENGGAHIRVSDTGMGIAPEDRSLVFQAFQQGQHDYEVSGTGLGLAISKHFVEAHGGKIWFESEVGVGTTFHVTLPILGMDKQEVGARAVG